MNLPLSEVYPDPNQPRKEFVDIEGLAESIRTHGLQEPIVVEETKKGYMINRGERRYKAHVMLGEKYIRCNVVKFKNDQQRRELQLIENEQRNDLTFIEREKAYDGMWRSGWYKGNVKKMASRLGKSESHVKNILKTHEIRVKMEANGIDTKTISTDVILEFGGFKPTAQEKVADLYKQKKIKKPRIKVMLKRYNKPKVPAEEQVKIKNNLKITMDCLNDNIMEINPHLLLYFNDDNTIKDFYDSLNLAQFNLLQVHCVILEGNSFSRSCKEKSFDEVKDLFLRTEKLVRNNGRTKRND